MNSEAITVHITGELRAFAKRNFLQNAPGRNLQVCGKEIPN